MICSLIVDLNGSREFPSDGQVLGRTMAAYPLMAAQACKRVKRIYLVSETPAVKAVALQYEAIIIDPPRDGSTAELAAWTAHGWRAMKEDLKAEEPVEMVALMFTHAAAVNGESIDEGLELMLADPKLDAVMTVTRSEFCEPRLALREEGGNKLAPFLPSPPKTGDAWFPDLAVTLLRPRCLDTMRLDAPIPWMAANVAPLKRDGSCPVDHEWQVPQVEFWLKRKGIVDIARIMEPQPKPLPKQEHR